MYRVRVCFICISALLVCLCLCLCHHLRSHSPSYGIFIVNQEEEWRDFFSILRVLFNMPLPHFQAFIVGWSANSSLLYIFSLWRVCVVSICRLRIRCLVWLLLIFLFPLMPPKFWMNQNRCQSKRFEWRIVSCFFWAGVGKAKAIISQQTSHQIRVK